MTNLVKLGPKPVLFLSHANVGDGVIRVWRDWLAQQADNLIDRVAPILWADAAQNVGVRFRVAHHGAALERLPVLVAAGEEMPVAYRLEFDELVVRTSRLLLMVEKSEAQEVTTSGKAVIIASI